MVKENEIIEALHERAKIIADFELLYVNGFPLLGPHVYGKYLHILTQRESESYGPLKWYVSLYIFGLRFV